MKRLLELLAVASDGSDEFSRALRLVADCLSENNTLRTLSMRKLSSLVGKRLALQRAYEAAVISAGGGGEFMEAHARLTDSYQEELLNAYRGQVKALMQ